MIAMEMYRSPPFFEFYLKVGLVHSRSVSAYPGNHRAVCRWSELRGNRSEGYDFNDIRLISEGRIDVS